MFVFLALSLFSVLDAFYDGRLYRCGIKFSGENLNEASDGEANVASVSSPDCQQESDDEDWEEREASRTHSVKFTDDLDQDQNKETPFVRQNTPHPKELKAKAFKLFGKGKAPDGKAAGGKAVDGKAAAEQLDASKVQFEPEKQTSEMEPLPLSELNSHMDTSVKDVDDTKEVGNKIPSKQVIMTQAPATVISSEPENQLASEAQESGSEEKESSEMEVDEDANEDQEDEETEKHVGFEVEEEEDASARPNRLHRRDTPHHLKDRRINVNLDHSKVASIIAQAISKKKEDDVDKGSFYPTPPESVGEQSQGMVCLLVRCHMPCNYYTLEV
ncbi:Protein lap4 [Zootermopsis nevadensis]|uniref:Protein lap4 n=1 Tax=Zootermopsis nevadensis TaxID=136037 RepID=A0A067QI05_ZOONE|nr:Protein lap4 [Zootermopsis nevadensis]